MDLANPMSSWEGWETWDFSVNAAAGEAIPGSYDCALLWWTVGTPVDPMTCDGCDFEFDVDYSIDVKKGSDNGEVHGCAGGDGRIRWAWYGGEGVLGYEYGGYLFGLEGTLTGATLRYDYGYTDYPYSGYYFTYNVVGEATVR